MTSIRTDGKWDRESRLAWITQQALQHNSITVDEISDALKVSRMTVHRDLDHLVSLGMVRKTRNGATALPSVVFESDVRYRLHVALSEKEAIAKQALSHVEPGQVIILDQATTLLPLAKQLASVTPLTVISNFAPILTKLTTVPGVTLIAVGGEYSSHFDTFSGLICEQTIASLRADAVFTSAMAVSDNTAYHSEPQMVRVTRLMMEVARRRYLLVDHTKFGKSALYTVAGLKQFDAVIVDSGLDEKYVLELQKGGIRLEIAPL